MDKHKQKLGYIRQHAEESFKNDLCCALDYPTPNPFTGKDLPEFEAAWRKGYDAEKAVCVQMGESANARDIEAALTDAGLGVAVINEGDGNG